MDSLCCCIDCARICHKGHDCRLKRTSPTAYCDCWEKYRCKSLVAGYQPARHSLLYRLLTETRLVCQPNGRGEHLLLFLAKCVERQYREQKQYRPSRRRFGTNSAAGGGGASSRLASVSSSTANEGSSGVSSGSAAPEEPDHDSTPPRFTRDAFELALDCPLAVESMLNMGVEVDPEPISVSGSSALCLLEEQVSIIKPK
ncbi:unnamed protein product [Protopolystoma xenopodis]|uniref:UBR-type domain-containing protein n=1 Tax=Protopolystoma xenopodis TaxID=117903 RepID=A0A448X5R7_9PLAT|nr:unnamed protein product [Protopolystoma xenopodis]